MKKKEYQIVSVYQLQAHGEMEDWNSDKMIGINAGETVEVLNAKHFFKDSEGIFGTQNIITLRLKTGQIGMVNYDDFPNATHISGEIIPIPKL